MDNQKELKQRYENVGLLIEAVSKTTISPSESVASVLSKGDAKRKALGTALLGGGAITAASATAIGGSAVVGGGLVAGATATALGGPIVWAAVGVGALGVLIGRLSKKNKNKKEKENLLKTIIAKQQAIINKLKNENELNKQEIQNLREALQMMRDAEIQVRNDFAKA